MSLQSDSSQLILPFLGQIGTGMNDVSLQTFLMQQPKLLEVVFHMRMKKRIVTSKQGLCLNSICTKLPKGRKVFICVC